VRRVRRRNGRGDQIVGHFGYQTGKEIRSWSREEKKSWEGSDRDAREEKKLTKEIGS
jgi:hypothetical protein